MSLAGNYDARRRTSILHNAVGTSSAVIALTESGSVLRVEKGSQWGYAAVAGHPWPLRGTSGHQRNGQ
jgi:hypothetical protein